MPVIPDPPYVNPGFNQAAVGALTVTMTVQAV